MTSPRIATPRAASGAAAKVEAAGRAAARASAAQRPVALLLGPHLAAVSGVSTHLNLLLASRLAEEFALVHFQVGSEGRAESAWSRRARLLASPFFLAAAILARGAAIVHINTSLNVRAYWRDLAYLIAAKLCGARVVYQVHGGALPEQFCRGSRAFRAFLRWTLRLPDALVVLAQAELRAYGRFIPEKQVVLIPNAIDCSPYAAPAGAKPGAAAPLRLAYVGRLSREKGLYELLDALKLAQAAGVPAFLQIAGSGPEEAPLRETVRALGLMKEVSFAGAVFGQEKVELLAAADVLALPSYSEGLPYALLEAMAAGAAVIATPVGAIPDVVVEGVHGLLVPLRDPAAIARAIGTLASDRDRLARMSEACRRRIAGSYSIERLGGEFRRLYAGSRAVKHEKALDRC